MDLRLVFISDTHGLHRSMKYKIPACDILIHSGDYTNRGEKYQVDDFFAWMNEQYQCTLKVFIEGNHDIHTDSRFEWETESSKWFNDLIIKHEINKKSVFRLENNSIELLGLKIWGSPITPSFYKQHWAHNADRGEEIKRYWDNIPLDTDIIITHGPVQYKVDYIPFGTQGSVGCADLAYKLQEVKPLIHCCGHIHCAYGVEETIDTKFINASICTEGYKPLNEPIIIDLTI